MPLRNPFARRPGPVVQDENLHPGDENPANPGFERVDTIGSSKASSAMSISSIRSQDTEEYKMSVVNDSGVYLPPSPTEEKAAWPRKYLSARTSSDTRSDTGEIEHFSISRESFDSYRRSFDISARSPVVSHDFPARQSLDSARHGRPPRQSSDRRRSPDLPTADESFEDVGLDDKQQVPPVAAPSHRRRLFFAKFADGHDKEPGGGGVTSAPGVGRFLMPGRKRGQSGQGAELGSIERPRTASSAVEVPEVA